MTIGTSTNRVSFNTDGVTTVFPVNLQSYLAADFTAILTSAAGVETTLILNSDYLLVSSGTLSPPFWTLTRIGTVWASGQTLQVFTAPVPVQQSSFVQGQAFPSLAVQTEFDRLTQMIQRLWDVLNRTVRAPDGDVSPQMQLLSAAARANTFPSFDALGNIALSLNLPTGALTQAIFNAFLASAPPLYPQTAAEVAAGVTPVAFQYAPGVVDRYGTNTTPGTTAMDVAFNAAVKQAKYGGATVIYGATAPYLLTAQIDCTTAVGATNYAITIRGESNNQALTTNAPYRPSLIVQQNGVAAFDCTGATGINFQNMSITTSTTTYPAVCFLMARTTSGVGQIARFDNVHVYGNFSDSVHYNYGSEDDVHTGCYYINALTTGATKVIRITANNVSALASSFTTINNVTSSTIDHSYIGCQFQNLSTTATADLVYLDGGADVRFYGCWAYMAGGRAMFYQDGTHSFTPSLVVRDWVTESISVCAYFVEISNNTGNVSGWCFDNVLIYTSGAWFNVLGATPVIDELYTRQILDSYNHGINIPGTLQNSVIYYQGTNITVGVSLGNELHGNCGGWAITTRSGDFWYGLASGGLSWTPVTTGLTIVGALTVTNKRIHFEGQMIWVTVTLSAATSIATSAGTNLGGLPFPATANSADVQVSVPSTSVGYAGGSVTSTTNVSLPAFSVGANVPVIVTARYPAS